MIHASDSIPENEEDAVDIIEAIQTSRSIRVFKPDPVPRKIPQKLLDVGRWAPSEGNVQPCYSEVLAGEPLVKGKARLEEKAERYSNMT